jgi:hypothetical protein
MEYSLRVGVDSRENVSYTNVWNNRRERQMCDCVKRIEEKTKESFTESKRFKKPVVRVQLDGVAFPRGTGALGMRTYNDLLVYLEGQKKKERVAMLHTFCPFCGVKYA